MYALSRLLLSRHIWVSCLSVVICMICRCRSHATAAAEEVGMIQTEGVQAPMLVQPSWWTPTCWSTIQWWGETSKPQDMQKLHCSICWLRIVWLHWCAISVWLFSMKLTACWYWRQGASFSSGHDVDHSLLTAVLLDAFCATLHCQAWQSCNTFPFPENFFQHWRDS